MSDPELLNSNMTKPENRFDQSAGILAVICVVFGCLFVLRPFFSAIVWSCIICFSTWPLYSRLEKSLRGKRTLAATVMTLLVAIVIVLPFLLIGISVVDNTSALIPVLKVWLHEGAPDPPAWLSNVPLVGNWVRNYWMSFAHNSAEFTLFAKNFIAEWRGWFLARSLDFGQIVAQLILSVFISFFIYRDGIAIVQQLREAERRIAGQRTERLIDVIAGTVRGVVYGILGTAAAQGFLAGVGLWFAGVPFPIYLGLLTFFLSLLPVGPPFVWGGAAIWLFYQGKVGLMVFMLIWGFFIVSGVDNILKPYLISRGSNLPFILVFLGVLGGVIAFGVLGIFVGPSLIAVGYVLVDEWSSMRANK